MNNRLEIKPATRNTANQMAPYLRAADVIEVYASSGMAPLEALLGSIEASDDDLCFAAHVDGQPICMFGANQITEDNVVGGIWLLGTDRIEDHPKDFMLRCKEYLAIMHERYEHLTNLIDARNSVTIGWLPHLGFRPVQRVEEWGHTKVPFIQYVSKRQ